MEQCFECKQPKSEHTGPMLDCPGRFGKTVYVCDSVMPSARPAEATLEQLLESARKHTMTPEEKEAQRQSWARGEMALDRPGEDGSTTVFPPRPAEAGTAEQLAKHVVDECLGKYPDDDREFTDLERDIASLIRPHLRAAAVSAPPSRQGTCGDLTHNEMDDHDLKEKSELTVEHFPMPTLADALCNACQLLDSVKADWQKDGCWSAWDQNVRDALSRELKKCYTEREAFEKWARTEAFVGPLWNNVDPCKRDHTDPQDYYYYIDVRNAWRSWQAAWRSRAGKGERG